MDNGLTVMNKIIILIILLLLSHIPSNSPIVHILSASCAGFVAATVTNPIWFVKTRLQLDHQRGEGLSVRRCVANIYNQAGLKGFYKGITASYFGISETVIHFVIYEALKAKLVSGKGVVKL